jgi:hypothetical protein
VIREEYREWKCRVHGVPWRSPSLEWQRVLEDGWIIRAVFGEHVLLARPVARTNPFLVWVSRLAWMWGLLSQRGQKLWKQNRKEQEKWDTPKLRAQRRSPKG